jgi:hypothetical protein
MFFALGVNLERYERPLRPIGKGVRGIAHRRTGFTADFSDPAPWFFRTLASWHAMLRWGGFDVVECREPTARGATTPSSIIYICIQRRTAAVI